MCKIIAFNAKINQIKVVLNVLLQDYCLMDYVWILVHKDSLLSLVVEYVLLFAQIIIMLMI